MLPNFKLYCTALPLAEQLTGKADEPVSLSYTNTWRNGLAKARAHIPTIYLIAAMVKDNVRAQLCYSIISSDNSACQCQGESNSKFK